MGHYGYYAFYENKVCVLIFEVKAVLSVCLVEIGMKVLCCNRF